ncbi:MAG: hypothetical protein IH602_11455 [Bryobacteraceae bacterium]|nr:hypothetical protein [Bryobacteraceae bacterium]
MAHHAERILNEAIEALRRTTGLKAEVVLHEPYRGEAGPDALIEIDVAQQKRRYLAEVKTVDRFATPAQTKTMGTAWDDPPILVAPHITRIIAERCRDLKLPFIDTAGNAYLEGPGFLIYVAGNAKKVETPRERFRALTQAGLRVTFVLLCQRGPIETNQRVLAAQAGVALGTIGPVVRDLEERGLALFAGKQVRILDPRRLLRDWVTHYPTTLRPKLRKWRFTADPETLLATDVGKCGAFWGGEVGGDRLTRMLKPATFTIYAREPFTPLLTANRMRADEKGNVEVIEAFWHFPPTPGLPPDVVPPLLVYADLLATNDGRNIEIAQLVYEQYLQPTFGQLG